MLSIDRVTSSDLLPLNNLDIPTLFHRSSGSRSYPDIFFAFFSLALSCSWEVLQNLCFDHLPILLSVPLFPVFRPNERLPSLNFRKARWNDFAFYFGSHCPSAEEYSSLFLSFAAVLFTSLTLNALLTIWCSGQTALFLFLLAKTALAYLPTACGIEATLFFSAGPVCSSLSAEACAIVQALCWSRQHHQVCHFSSLLLLSDSRSVVATLFSPPSFLLPQSLSETVFSLFQFYQTTMGPRTLVSSGRRCG